jgi:hypothetical protein
MKMNRRKLELFENYSCNRAQSPNLKSSGEIFRALWTNVVVVQVEICDFVVLILNRHETRIELSVAFTSNLQLNNNDKPPT